MLKLIFWSLLLANIAVFTYQQGYLGLSDGHEPGRASKQLNAEKIAVLSASAASAAIVTEPVVNPPEKPVEIIACTEVGNFLQADAKRFELRLATLKLGDRQSRLNVKEVASHMVYIPPQADKEAAEKKAAQLTQLGVTNFFIIQENSNMKWGISLGVFKTEEAAQTHLANLVKKGVRSAQIGARSVTTNKLAYQLRALDPDAKAAFDKIKEEFPGQEVRRCEPPKPNA